VIPKQPAVTLDQLSEAYGAAIGRVLPRLCRALLEATGATAFNVLQNNGTSAHQAIPYVHFHIIPKYPDGSGLGIGWKPRALSEEEGRLLAREIAVQL
jgi:histidine triad (HIT) family protein